MRYVLAIAAMLLVGCIQSSTTSVRLVDRAGIVESFKFSEVEPDDPRIVALDLPLDMIGTVASSFGEQAMVVTQFDSCGPRPTMVVDTSGGALDLTLTGLAAVDDSCPRQLAIYELTLTRPFNSTMMSTDG